MAANKRKQDEKHLKILREMVSLPHNKYCFDCNQRGPTYVNMTVGSFICTACSGMLRGLNPPHRVKSISMTSFTQEEMDFLKSHGNDLCRKVWLALYDTRLHSDHDSKDEQKRKDFMAQKYEKKRWHQAPTDAMLQDARVQNDTLAGKMQTKPLKTLLGHNATRLVTSEPQQSARPVAPGVPTGSLGSAQQPQRTVTPSLSQGSISSTGSQQSATSQPSRPHAGVATGIGAFDLLADLGGADPFAPRTTAPSPSQRQIINTNSAPSGGFANFDSAFNATSGDEAVSSSTSNKFAGVSLGGAVPGTVQASAAFGSFAVANNNQATQNHSKVHAVSSHGDKYAALADLDNLFGSSSGHSINWDGQFSSPPRNSGGAAGTQMSGWPPQQQAAPVSSVSNPFSSAPVHFGQSQQSAPNPFGAVAANQPAFTQSNSYPAFPAQNSSSFGQFTSSQSHYISSSGSGSGFGNNINNGAHNWSTGQSNQMFAQQQQPMAAKHGSDTGYQSQTQGSFSPWNQASQPVAANPFMNITAQQGLPAKSQSTNPFL